MASNAEPAKTPFQGILRDIAARKPFYIGDWVDDVKAEPKAALTRIVAAAVYIFFASAIPAIAFGLQLKKYTHDQIGIVHTLASTAITGCLQALLGGQPLLIVGVAEPIVIIYHFLHEFAEDNDIPLVPWSGWVCVWAGIFVFLMAVFNACNFISKFTRFSGEIFALIIAILFLQQAIKGLVEEFDYPGKSPTDPDGVWTTMNGIFGILLALIYIYASIMLSGARKWKIGNSLIRALLSDYGSAIMIVVISALSFALKGNGDVPHRMYVFKPSESTWIKTGIYTPGDMADIETKYIFAAMIPGLVISVLFYFDHSVSSMLAQQQQFNVKKPSAYHYDLFLLAGMTLLCGLIGLPPVNGVLPQAPLHTKSLCSKRKRMVQAGEDGMNGSDVEKPAGKENGSSLVEQVEYIVYETRLSNMIQATLVFLSMLVGYEFLNNVPTSVIWAFFAFMSIESLPGNELWDRIQIIMSDRKRRKQFLETNHYVYLETVKFETVRMFTILQVVLLLCIWAITVWTGLFGISFPLWIMALVPFRSYVLPKFMDEKDLADLDSSELEELPAGKQLDSHENDQYFPDTDSDTRSVADEFEDRMEGRMIPGFKHTLTEDEIRQRRAKSNQK